MKNLVYLNGKFLPEAEAVIGVSDRGFLFGDGVFDTMRAYGGVPFMIERHLDRLYDSADFFGFCVEVEKKEMIAIVAKLLAENGLSEANIRITVTRGAHTGDLSFNADSPPTVLVVAKPVNPPTDRDYADGVAAITVRGFHNPPYFARHKTTSYLPYLAAKNAATQAGARTAIIVSNDGRLLESATGNVFAVKDGVAITPPVDEGILPGIARGSVIEIMRKNGIECYEERLSESDLLLADEAFITNSIVEALGIKSINGTPLKGVKLATKIRDSYRRQARI